MILDRMIRRIADHTLTIKKKGIMTTKRGFEMTPDVLDENDVFNIRLQEPDKSIHLSAALRLYRELPLATSQEKAIKDIFMRICEHKPMYSAWLLMSNGGKVPPTRIVRHYKLWRSLEKSSIVLPAGRRTHEYLIEDGDGLQYFGAIALQPEFSFQGFVELVRSHSATHLVLAHTESPIIKLLEGGWFYDSRKYPTSILRYIERAEMFLLATLGDFDDDEGGAVVLAKPPLIQECFSR